MTFRVAIASTMKGTAGYNNNLEGTTLLRVEATNPEDPASVSTPTPATFNLIITPDCTKETIDAPASVAPAPITYTTKASALSVILNDWTYLASCGVEYFLYCECDGDPYNPYTPVGYSWPAVKTSVYSAVTSPEWTITGAVPTSNSPGNKLIAFLPASRTLIIEYTVNNKYAGSTPIELELWATNTAGITPVS